jgi:hypothetical protein
LNFQVKYSNSDTFFIETLELICEKFGDGGIFVKGKSNDGKSVVIRLLDQNLKINPNLFHFELDLLHNTHRTQDLQFKVINFNQFLKYRVKIQ